MIHQDFKSGSGKDYSVDLLPRNSSTPTLITAFISSGNTEADALSIQPEDAATVAGLIMASHNEFTMEETGRYGERFTQVTVGQGPSRGSAKVPTNEQTRDWLVNSAAAQLLAARAYQSALEEEAATEDAERLDDEAVALYNAWYETESDLEDVRNTDELPDWRGVAQVARKLYAK